MLQGLVETERHAIGSRPVAGAMAMAGWNAALPSVRKWALGDSHGFTDQADGTSADMPLSGHLVALHGFIKKTRTTRRRSGIGAHAPEGVGAMSKNIWDRR